MMDAKEAKLTPRCNALTARMATELDRPILVQDHFIELCDFARKLERENADLVVTLEFIASNAEQLASDPMGPQRGMWAACAEQARSALTRATEG